MPNQNRTLETAETRIRPIFQELENVLYVNQRKVLEAFRTHRVASHHFAPTTGYGYNDSGRETLEHIYADLFGGECALVRSQIISGTHALSACLQSMLIAGDLLVSAAHRPYDTLYRVITGPRGLVARGIRYHEVPLAANGSWNPDGLREALLAAPRLLLVQRSAGYHPERQALSIADIEDIVRLKNELSSETIVLVDNCYGEFVEVREPCQVGADLTAGSLIKNPGGGLSPGGGYIVGRESLVEQVADYLVAPGLGFEIGPSLYDLRIVYQGLFLAPQVVCEALKTAHLVASAMDLAGYAVRPGWDARRTDIVQAVVLPGVSQLLAFARTVQAFSPVESHVKPEFAPLPGYEHDVVMAAGTFVQGSSIELSCDAPGRSPYIAFVQGGLTYAHGRLVVEELLKLVTSDSF
ncbi:MAG: methionine gamma-lyase family protein [Solirubrobacterales bacterium]